MQIRKFFITEMSSMDLKSVLILLIIHCSIHRLLIVLQWDLTHSIITVRLHGSNCATAAFCLLVRMSIILIGIFLNRTVGFMMILFPEVFGIQPPAKRVLV